MFYKPEKVFWKELRFHAWKQNLTSNLKEGRNSINEIIIKTISLIIGKNDFLEDCTYLIFFKELVVGIFLIPCYSMPFFTKFSYYIFYEKNILRIVDVEKQAD